MAHTHTYKTDPYWVKEARGEERAPTQFRREHSVFTRHTRGPSKRIRARERREMDRIARDLSAWDGTAATLREFAADTDRLGG